MRQRMHIIILATTMILLIGVVLSQAVVGAQSGPFQPPHPLVNATSDEVAQAAKNYTVSNFKVVSGTPTVLLTRSVTKEDLPKLGLSTIAFGGEDPPLMLVALKGDFDVQNMPGGGSTPWRVGYIVYVFDLKAGMPALISVSRLGGRFRTLLNDPTLPDEGLPTQSQQPNAGQQSDQQQAPFISPIPASPVKKLPYGSIAPGAPDPTPLPTP